MKTRTFVIILILVFAVLLISSCAITPIIIKTVESGDYSEVKRLIEEGADVNTQANTGETALIVASAFGHTEVVKSLIEAGAK